MPTINRIGKETINDRLVFEVTGTDPSTVFVEVELFNQSANPYPIGGTTGGSLETRATLRNDPEVGTTDTFRIEVNRAVRSFGEVLFGNAAADLKRFPELLTYDFLTNVNTMISYPYAGVTVKELDANLSVVSSTTYSADQRVNVYPLNLFRGETFTKFELGSSGDTSRDFLTDAPLIQDIKRGDFIWIWIFKTDFTGAPRDPLQEIVIQELDADNNVLTTTTADVNPELSDVSVKNHPVGFQFQMSTDPNVVSFQAFVRDKAIPNTERSKTRRWNAKEYCDEVKLWWQTRFNTFELTYFEGNRAKRLVNKRRTVERAEPINATYEEGGTNIFTNEFVRNWRASIKRGTPDYIEYLTGILYSKRLVIEENGELVEVVITNTNIEEFEKDESIQFLTFDFTESKRTEIW